MKLQDERKSLAVESVKMLVVVGVFVAIYIGVSAWASSAEQSKTESANLAAQQQSEIATLRSKIDSSGSSQKLFATVVEDRKNEQFEIDNEKVRDVLQDLVKRYRLSVSDKLEYSAEKDFKHPELATVTIPIIVRQEARLKFSAISDLHAYAFMQALSRELPGVVRYTQFKLMRKAPLDAEAVTQLAAGKSVYTVDVELAFDWFGFKPVDAPVTAPAPAAGVTP